MNNKWTEDYPTTTDYYWRMAIPVSKDALPRIEIVKFFFYKDGTHICWPTIPDDEWCSKVMYAGPIQQPEMIKE
jgi:hypothetical protein